MTIHKPTTSSNLQDALNKAVPGDSIELMAIKYVGSFIHESRRSPNSPPITIYGTNKKPKNEKSKSTGHSIVESNSTAFRIIGGSWIFRNMTIHSQDTGIYGRDTKMKLNRLSIRIVNRGIFLRGSGCALESLDIGSESTTKNANVGIVITGSRNSITHVICNGDRRGILVHGDSNSIQDCKILGSKEQAIFLKGKNNSIRNTTCSAIHKFGILVDVGSRNTQIQNTVVKTGSSSGISLLLRQQTYGTVMKGSTFHLVTNKGHKGRFLDCHFGGINVTGANNVFNHTTIGALYMPFKKNNVYSKNTTIRSIRKTIVDH